MQVSFHNYWGKLFKCSILGETKIQTIFSGHLLRLPSKSRGFAFLALECNINGTYDTYYLLHIHFVPISQHMESSRTWWYVVFCYPFTTSMVGINHCKRLHIPLLVFPIKHVLIKLWTVKRTRVCATLLLMFLWNFPCVSTATLRGQTILVIFQTVFSFLSEYYNLITSWIIDEPWSCLIFSFWFPFRWSILGIQLQNEKNCGGFVCRISIRMMFLSTNLRERFCWLSTLLQNGILSSMIILMHLLRLTKLRLFAPVSFFNIEFVLLIYF